MFSVRYLLSTRQIWQIMDKKTKKKIEVTRQRINKLRVLLTAAKQQPDDPDEITRLEEQIKSEEAEIEKLQAG